MLPDVLPLVLPLGAATLTSLTLAVAAWRRRGMPGAAAFAALMLSAAWWSATYATMLAAPDLAGKAAWFDAQYPGIVVVPLAWLVFATQYSGREAWLARASLILTTAVGLVWLAVVATNGSHHLYLASFAFDSQLPGPVVRFGPLYWAFSGYSQVMLTLGLGLLLVTLARSRRRYREQAAVLLLGDGWWHLTAWRGSGGRARRRAAPHGAQGAWRVARVG